MTNAPSWLAFLIWGLAVFRLSILFSEDSGPWKVFTKLRSKLKKEAKTNKPLRQSAVHEGISCLRCESLWWAPLIVAFVYFKDRLIDEVAMAGDALILCMALSAASILWNRAFPKR